MTGSRRDRQTDGLKEETDRQKERKKELREDRGV